MRRKLIGLIGVLLLCPLGGCVVRDHNPEAGPMWWPTPIVRQGMTEDQWGGQSIFGGDRWKVSKQGVTITHAPPKYWMQSLPSAPAQPEM